MRALPIAACVVVGCAGSEIPAPRFANAVPVKRVDDQRDVARPPQSRQLNKSFYHFAGSFTRPIERALTLETSRRARGVNAIDEVPDSSWFTNRIAVRELTPDEIRTGPLTIENPDQHTPWTILSRKSDGEALGLLVRDARGERFLVKFDRRGFPEVETAAHVITNRLLWATGYNVPEDFVSEVTRADLRIDPKATWTDPVGDKITFRADDLDAMLAQAEPVRDGRFRMMASRILPGKALGGHPDEGVRADDPNDRIPHELRRDLRGAKAVFAWLDHVDVKEANSLDMWVADDRRKGRHFVRHYFLDFGKSLGAMALIARDARCSYEYKVDYAETFASLATLGLRSTVWTARTQPQLRGVGIFDTHAFAPGEWKPYTQAYRPFLVADRYDWLWGAKLVIRFTPEQLRAAVEAGELTDPRAEEFLVSALRARQRAVAHHAFSRVRPIFDARMLGRMLCFEDLMIVHGLASRQDVTRTRYQVTTYDRQGRKLAPAKAVGAARGGHTCSTLEVARADDRYTIARIQTNGSSASTYVHVARDPGNHALRVIGLWRQ